MQWSQWLNSSRRKDSNSANAESSPSETAGGRQEIERDYDRILFAAPTRRLADKTQVFPLDKNITDLISVSKGKTLCKALKKFDQNRALYQTLKKLNVSSFPENKFGGFRLTHSRMDFDIWRLEDTWAFREDIISLHNIDSLLHTTLMTWDAVIYDIQ